MVNIKILAVPPGEAPLEVRKQWVGLTLPAERLPNNFPLAGVVTGNPVKETGGYAVVPSVAIKELERNNLPAAEWWKIHLSRRAKHLVFDGSVCEPIY
ncbi:MAG: hypothetical protein UU13_C0003G0010 [Candidatus Nomurabacteria bacterium GW2011_GWB1_40_7]|uniref:Uncharacterized protein n=1 Tax=Candidatus Nomurabacteria bacterium GW2011_GWB1_40_7 TaxID=1618744 RepID=A0A0G0T724_9BACT|nr:MAG: hypothetical protein UU13_C0003G0010 [Candidatus Nomurabacteria bacterium GW2011_GWB1_40_7]